MRKKVFVQELKSSFFYSDDDRKLIFKTLSGVKSMQERRDAYSFLSEKLNRSKHTIRSQFYSMKKEGSSKKIKESKIKAPIFGKGTVLNFPVTRAVLEEGKVTLYFD